MVTSADLGVAKSDDVDPVLAGGTLTYTIDVTNSGPSDADSRHRDRHPSLQDLRIRVGHCQRGQWV